jgi:hypothetical protein
MGDNVLKKGDIFVIMIRRFGKFRGDYKGVGN